MEQAQWNGIRIRIKVSTVGIYIYEYTGTKHIRFVIQNTRRRRSPNEAVTERGRQTDTVAAAVIIMISIRNTAKCILLK